MEERLVDTCRELGTKGKRETRKVDSLNQHRLSQRTTFSFLGVKIVHSQLTENKQVLVGRAIKITVL